MRQRRKTKPKPDALTQTAQVCGKKACNPTTSGWGKLKRFDLHNPQPLGVIRPVEPGNIQIGLPNDKDPTKTDEA